MERVEIAEGVEFSRIVYGMWRLTEDDTSPDHVRAKIEACLEQGITTIDQADIYGGYTAEGVMGKALTNEIRDRIEVVTKCGIVAPVGRHAEARVKHYDLSRAHIERAVESSRRDMGLDAIDLLLIHRPSPFMDADETGAVLDDLVAKGHVRAVGVSNFRPWDLSLLQSRMETRLVVNQIEMSLAHVDPFVNGDLAHLMERRVRAMAWSPLGGGTLMMGHEGHAPLRTRMANLAKEAGVDMAAVAVSWLLAHPAGIMPVMGTNTLDRIATFGDAWKVGMDRETWFALLADAQGQEVP